jgi:hypothetical protein
MKPKYEGPCYEEELLARGDMEVYRRVLHVFEEPWVDVDDLVRRLRAADPHFDDPYPDHVAQPKPPDEAQP